jgi:tetratricopeptide (TPR) repeat protein
MVELQQSMNGVDTVLSFGAKSVRPDLLEQMLIGRRSTVELLEKAATAFACQDLNQQFLVIGPRGSGKTHLLRVLYHRLQHLITEKKLIVAYFSEDEYGISGYLDFLIRIINSFIRWYEEDAIILKGRLELIRTTHKSLQEETAEKMIWDYTGNKPLLILLENFDIILESIGTQGQNKLRSLLYRHNKISIIATAQAVSKDINKEDRPFYNFFTPIYLKRLSFEESLALLQTMAKMDSRTDITELLEHKGRYQVRAIHEMVKGNHRLMITFYEFLKADIIADLSVLFMKTMNDLKPYYESFIRYLPPQEQKILYYLALLKTPRRGSEIAKDCFIPDKSISKLLSELQRRKLVESYTDPESKRDKLYDIAEPLLRIGIEIGEQKEGIVGLFVDFLALYYSMDELKNQKRLFEARFVFEDNPSVKQKFYYETEIRTRAIETKLKIPIERSPEYECWREAYKLFEQKEYVEFTLLAQMVDTQLKDFDYYFLLGYAYGEIGDKAKAIEAYCVALEFKPEDTHVLYNLALDYEDLGEYEKAKNLLLKIVSLDPEYYEVYNDLGIVYEKLNKKDLSIESFMKAIESTTKPFNAYFNLGLLYLRDQKFDAAIEQFKESIRIKPNYARSLFNLGISYCGSRQYERGVKPLMKSIKLKPKEAFVNMLFYSEESADFFKSVIRLVLREQDIAAPFSESIIWGLKNTKKLDESGIVLAIEIIEELLHSPESLSIVKNYLEIMRRFMFQQDTKSIYDLPKEQRDFFMKEFIDPRTKESSIK